VRVTTALPLQAAAAIKANPSGTASSFDHAPRIFEVAENLRMRVLFKESGGLESGKHAKICEVAVMKANVAEQRQSGAGLYRQRLGGHLGHT
jgi:hypothetical protein